MNERMNEWPKQIPYIETGMDQMGIARHVLDRGAEGLNGLRAEGLRAQLSG